MSKPMRKSDPAYWMLEEGLSGKRKIKVSPVYNKDCYICGDSEFALMGLPLCYPCYLCGGHVAADDIVCDNGHNQEDDPRLEEMEREYEERMLKKVEMTTENNQTKEFIGDKIMRELIEKKAEDLEDLWKIWDSDK